MCGAVTRVNGHSVKRNPGFHHYRFRCVDCYAFADSRGAFESVPCDR